jgi:dTDP-4-dehydrorhamnose reductase
MRIAVLGSTGQLGRDLCPLLPGEVIPLTRAQADLTNPELLAKALGEARPGVVVNCAAYNFVDRAEAESEAAFEINAWGVRRLALLCSNLKAKLVHFSTDYVFGLDMARTTPYAEDEPPGPISVYALSKLVGEYWVRSLCPQHLVIRTCGLYGVWGVGGKGRNFVETMLRMAQEGKPIRVVNDQRCTPTYTRDLAEGTVALIHSQASGVYHVTNAGDATWFEFAQAIFECAGVRPSISAITSGEFASAARRPAFSVLDCSNFSRQTGQKLRTWKTALKSYLQERSQKSASSSTT